MQYIKNNSLLYEAPDNFYYKCDRCNKEVQRAYILRTNFPSALPAIPVYYNTYICEECMEDVRKIR